MTKRKFAILLFRWIVMGIPVALAIIFEVLSHIFCNLLDWLSEILPDPKR